MFALLLDLEDVLDLDDGADLAGDDEAGAGSQHQTGGDARRGDQVEVLVGDASILEEMVDDAVFAFPNEASALVVDDGGRSRQDEGSTLREKRRGRRNGDIAEAGQRERPQRQQQPTDSAYRSAILHRARSSIRPAASTVR